MKRITYLSFYYEPDLCAGSFRNTSLVKELCYQAKSHNVIIDLYTTMPNRYNSYTVNAPEYEEIGNLIIHRIKLPNHKSGFIDQIISFSKFYFEVLNLNKSKKSHLVVASSSRLFTAFLGYKIACASKCSLILDIRDIFVDTMMSVLNKKIKFIILPIIKNFERKTFRYAKHINLISPGFKPYFEDYNLNTNFSFFTNGIDEDFLTKDLKIPIEKIDHKIEVTYAGNIGEGQGLHKIIPDVAEKLKDKFHFIIYGDGGARSKLASELAKRCLLNVEIKPPVPRFKLIEAYNNSDYLFLHLNDYEAFEKVLPSKIFELSTFSKPILAGVSGFAKKFIEQEVKYSFVFKPCDSETLVQYLKSHSPDENIERDEFIKKYKRSAVNKNFAKLILNYL